MVKRIYSLMAAAICAVVLSHAASFGQNAMVWGIGSVKPLEVPNLQWIGSFPYYVLLTVRQLTTWAVPALLFVSGYFVTYAMPMAPEDSPWKMVRARLTRLIIPYVIWSSVWFVVDAVQGSVYAPIEYVKRLALGRADGGYYYVVLLCQLYLLSPQLLSVARSRPRLLLWVTGLLQLAALSTRYLGAVGVPLPDARLTEKATVNYLPFMWLLYFAVGLVSAVDTRRFREWMTRHKVYLLVATAVLGLLAVVEPEAIHHTTGAELRYLPRSVFSSLYSIGFILSYLSLDQVGLGLRVAQRIARTSFPIYLLHFRIMKGLAEVASRLSPWMLERPVVVLSPILAVFGLGVPFLLAQVVEKSAIRRYYRYLFG